MTHEGHITVGDDPTLKAAGVFREHVKSMGMKPIFIKLEKGAHRSQLMAGIKFKELNDVEAGIQLGKIAGDLQGKGYPVTRIKLESNVDLNEPQPLPVVYYECHHKIEAPAIEIKPTESYDFAVSRFMAKFNDTFPVGVSYNVFTGHWYITCRSQTHSLVTFERVASAVNYKFRVLGSHTERVIVDTNPGLDEGWM